MVGSYDGFGYLFHSVILLILLLYSIHFTSNCEAVAFVSTHTTDLDTYTDAQAHC